MGEGYTLPTLFLLFVRVGVIITTASIISVYYSTLKWTFTLILRERPESVDIYKVTDQKEKVLESRQNYLRSPNNWRLISYTLTSPVIVNFLLTNIIRETDLSRSETLVRRKWVSRNSLTSLLKIPCWVDFPDSGVTKTRPLTFLLNGDSLTSLEGKREGMKAKRKREKEGEKRKEEKSLRPWSLCLLGLLLWKYLTVVLSQWWCVGLKFRVEVVNDL